MKIKKPMFQKVFVNKRTNQMSVVISKKQARASNPTLKFGKDLFVKLEFIDNPKVRK